MDSSETNMIVYENETSDKILEVMPSFFVDHVPEIIDLISDYCKDKMYITQARSHNFVIIRDGLSSYFNR
jgi:hypothetical protein